jgi:ribosome-binding factor A
LHSRLKRVIKFNILEESQRQKKIGSVLQNDLVEVLQSAATQGGMRGVLISVSKVKVTVDLGVAKVYLSIFPNDKAKELLIGIKSNTPLIRHELAQRTKNQLRRMPNLEFFIDDSLEYIEKIDKSLKGEENPIKDPSILDKRKKS